MTRCFIVLVAILSMACAKSDHLMVEDEFTAGEFDLIQEAAWQWRTACDCTEADLVLSQALKDSDGNLRLGEFQRWSSDFRMWKMHTDDHAYQPLVNSYGSFAGLYLGGNIAIVAEETEDPEKFYSVVLHELGHLHGIGHLDDGIMKRINAGPACIDELALEAICVNYRCGPYARVTCP